MNINENDISTAEFFDGHPTLEVLEMKVNKLKNLKGISNMPCLRELNVEENLLTNYRDLNNLDKL